MNPEHINQLLAMRKVARHDDSDILNVRESWKPPYNTYLENSTLDRVAASSASHYVVLPNPKFLMVQLVADFMIEDGKIREHVFDTDYATHAWDAVTWDEVFSDKGFSTLFLSSEPTVDVAKRYANEVLRRLKKGGDP